MNEEIDRYEAFAMDAEGYDVPLPCKACGLRKEHGADGPCIDHHPDRATWPWIRDSVPRRKSDNG